MREHLEARNYVGNLGNMIHRMAMIQMMECDRANSSQINLFRLMNKVGSATSAAALLDRNFDGLVLTMSNMLRPDASEPGMGELIRNIRIPVYCFGLGIQNALPDGDEKALMPDILDLLRALDDKSTIFGVRGETTLAWLKTIGIKNAKALGCPSMFAYPKNIMSVAAPVQPARFITAGHLAMTNQQDSRGHKLMRGFRAISPSYVFQGEVAHFKELLYCNIYDEATQTLERGVIAPYIEKRMCYQPPFDRYYSFSESSSWRQACAQFDVYVGDRIHCGVAALQVGVPALILYADARVQELAAYHGIPSCSLDDFEAKGPRAVIEENLNAGSIETFKDRYCHVLRKFEQTIDQVGLSLVNRITSRETLF